MPLRGAVVEFDRPDVFGAFEEDFALRDFIAEGDPAQDRAAPVADPQQGAELAVQHLKLLDGVVGVAADPVGNEFHLVRGENTACGGKGKPGRQQR